MALLDTRSRSGYLFVAVAMGHIILISAQVNSRSGVPLLQAVVFGALAEVQRATGAVTGGIRRAWDGYLYLQRAQADNEALREEVADLRVKLQQARAEAAEAGNLRNLLALRDRSKMPTRAAEVIGTSATPEFRTVTIDRGSGDGIQRDMAVVGPAGAVGRVVMSSRGAAKVQLLIDRSAAAAVMVQRSRAQGIVFGTGEPLLRLDYLSTTADVQNGDVLVTSGIDGIYPEGFVVGRIETLERVGGTFKTIRVRPAVNFSDLEEVLVVLALPAPTEGVDPAADSAPAPAAGPASAPAKPPGQPQASASTPGSLAQGRVQR